MGGWLLVLKLMLLDGRLAGWLIIEMEVGGEVKWDSAGTLFAKWLRWWNCGLSSHPMALCYRPRTAAPATARGVPFCCLDNNL